jgi:hypothetical protein
MGTRGSMYSFTHSFTHNDVIMLLVSNICHCTTNESYKTMTNDKK